jgi:glycosyltransferase involved in cell wall biosynthesis
VDFHVFDGKFQGSRSHLLGVFSELVALRPDWRFFFFLDDTESLARMSPFQRSNVELVRMPRANPLVRLGWQLPRLRRRLRLDIMHTQYVMPLQAAQGNAVTVHDVLFESHPQYFQRLFVWRARCLIRWSARRADLLLTVSEFSRGELASRYGLDPQRIAVLLNAVDSGLFFPGEEGLSILARRSLQAHSYLLTVGRIEPRKNHATLLRAYGRLPGDPPPLVIVGQRDFGYHDFDAALARLPPGRQVLLLDDVDDQELPVLYRHALAFVYPSFAEGFGMPPLEAMASGLPVITSNTTALPEVVGDAGLTVDPFDDQTLAEAIERVCNDALLRQRLRQQGLDRSRQFTWTTAAQTLAQAYETYLHAPTLPD